MSDDFQDELESLVNRYSKENGSNTPDYVLARYISDCLEAFNRAVNRREEHYGRKDGANDRSNRSLDS